MPFDYSIRLLTGIIGGVATAFGSNVSRQSPEAILFVTAFLLLPTMPLASLFFDDGIRQDITGIYIHEELIPKPEAAGSNSPETNFGSNR